MKKPKSKPARDELKWRVAKTPSLALRITEPDHLMILGAHRAVERLCKALDELGSKTPVIGVSVSLIHLEAEELRLRGQLLEKNYKLMAANGVDISQPLTASLRNDVLHVTPMVMTLEFVSEFVSKDDSVRGAT